MKARSRPLEALALVIGGWTAFRIGALLPGQSSIPASPTETISSPKSAISPTIPASAEAIFHERIPIKLFVNSNRGAPPRFADTVQAKRVDDQTTLPTVTLAKTADAAPDAKPAASELSPKSSAPTPTRAQTGAAKPSSHYSLKITGSAWVLVRPASTGKNLADFGQLGGSQAGIRLFAPLVKGIRLTGRASAPLSGLGTDASMGMAIKPTKLPVELLLERRFAIDRGGRNAFSATLTANMASRTIVKGWQIEGYGQAGLVGLRHPNLFADGALQFRKEIVRTGKIRIEAGSGIWAAAQEGVSRLDAGPSLSAFTPNFRATLEWRQRLAGNAKPSSGPSVTLSSSF